jgi:penicillin amidase
MGGRAQSPLGPRAARGLLGALPLSCSAVCSSPAISARSDVAPRAARRRRALRRRGLEAELTILRDGHGVPHIWAKSARDAWFGLGFAQAQDRLAQLSFLVRAARGRSAEVLGPEALEADRFARTLGFGRPATPNSRLTRRRRARCACGGISAWIEEVKSGRAVTPVPLTRLGVPLETWSAADSLAVAKLVAWGLDGSLDATLVLSDLIEKLGGFGARPFFPPEAAREMTPRPPDFAATKRESWRDPLREALGLAGRSIGSSAWAIASGDAEGGAPIVTGDLHLAPTVPALLYEAHLAAPDFEVAGAGVPGVPAFWSGHNGRVAWAATHARAVATDLYVETLDPEAPDRYRVGGDHGARDAPERTPRGRDDAVLTVRETQHGPPWRDCPGAARARGGVGRGAAG